MANFNLPNRDSSSRYGLMEVLSLLNLTMVELSFFKISMASTNLSA